MTTPTGGAFRNVKLILSADNSNLMGTLRSSERGVEHYTNSVKKSNDTMSAGKVAAAGLAAGAVAVGAGLAYSVTQAVQFDKAMRNVNSLTMMNEKDFAALEQRVINVSKVLPQSATVLAEGLYDIASSGFAGADGMLVLESAAKGASAGLTTTATSAKAITAVLNAYGRGAEDAADVTDVLFQTVNLGVVSFEELAGSIGDVVGIAAPLGVQIDELGSAIATMTTQGVSGSESTTLLTNLFTKMIRPSEALADHMHTLGYESGEAMLKANGLRGTMELLRESTGGNITALMELFPDIQAARGALSLMANEGMNYAKASEQIESAEARRGATQRTLNEQMKGVANQAQLAKNQLDALAITTGVRLLPALLATMKAAGQLGSEIKGGLVELGQALGPTWENLTEILRDSWEVLTDLGEAFGPLAAAVGKVAVGTLVVGMNALTEVMSVLTGLIADNEGVAIALAIALGIQLLGGVTALTTKIQVGLVVALVDTIGMMGKTAASAAGLKAALAGLFTSTAFATGGLIAVLTGAVMAWQGYGDGVERAEQALSDFKKSQRSDELKDQIAGVEAITQAYEDMEDRLVELDNRGVLSQLFNVKAAGEELGIRRRIQEVSDEAERAEKELETLRGSVLRYLAEESGMGPNQIAERFASAEGATKSFADALPMLEKAGVKVGDSYSEITRKLDAYKASTEGTAAAEQQLIDALGEVEAGVVDTEEAVKSLKTALDALMGVFLSADSAAIALEGALDDMAETLSATDEEGRKLGQSLDITTERGRENKSAIIEAVEALKDKIEADAAAGASGQDLATTLEDGRKKLIEQATAAGLPREAMIRLLEQYNLTPELVDTVVKAIGTPEAVQNVQSVQTALQNLKDKDVTVRVAYTSMGAKRVVGVGGGLQEKDGGVVQYYAEGGVNGENHVAQIAPAGAWRVWAEPETGGEAYIPLAPEKRGRSQAILEEVAHRFGARIEYNAEGSVTVSKVFNDGLRAIQELAKTAKLPAEEGVGRFTGGGGGNASIVAFGRMLQAMGVRVAEHPAFGGVAPVHKGRGHYEGRAIDVNTRAGTSRAEQAELAPIVDMARKAGFFTIFMAPGHYGHAHIEKRAKGGIFNPHIRDNGGPLLPGYTYNGTGAPEMVIPMAAGGITTKSTAKKAAKQTAEQRQQAAELASSLMANRMEWAAEHLGIDKQIKYYGDLIKKSRQYSDEWMAAARKREDLLKEQAAARAAIAENRWEYNMERASTAAQIAELNKRIKNEKEYTDRWMQLVSRRKALIEEQQAKATEALEKLNDLLRQETELRARAAELVAQQAKARADFDRASAAAQTEYAKAIAEANQELAAGTSDVLESRRRQIIEWMRLDELMASRRSSGFAITSDDEEAARAALRSAGLLTEAMEAWNESQSPGGAMSASALAANAREQAEIIARWSNGLGALRARGLSEEVITQLGLGDSPEALAQVEMFSKATQEEIDDLNAAVAAKTKAAGAVVSKEHQNLLGTVGQQIRDLNARNAQALADASARLTESLADAQAVLTDRLAELDQELAANAAQLAQLGQNTGLSYGEAIAAGLNSSIPAIRAAAQAAQAAMNAANAAAAPPVSAPPASAPSSSSKASMVNGKYIDNATGRLAYYGPHGEPGVADAQKVNGMNSHIMPDGRKAWYWRVAGRVYDTGGILPPGGTLAMNLTGQNEYVLTAAQLKAGFSPAAGHFGGGGRPTVQVTYQVDARGAVEGTAAQISRALDAHTEALIRVVTAGTGD